MTARETRRLDPLAEGLLLALSLLSVVGCYRLFLDWSFFWRLAACAAGGHVAGMATRRRRLGTAASTVLALLAMGVLVALTMYPGTTFLGLPTADTLATARDDLARTAQTFNDVRAPAPVSLPLLLPAALFAWWAAFVADWAAFRLRFSYEALVPLVSVFVFSSLIGVRTAQVPLTTAFVGLALGFLVVHRIGGQQAAAGWVAREGNDGPGALLRTGAGLVACAALLAALIGPLVPGSHSSAAYELRPGPGGSGSSRTVTSPLVEIRKRLLEQTNLELFTVRSSARAYWRLTALDAFDGNLWSSNGSYDNIDGRLPSKAGYQGTAESIDQTFTIEALQSPWLPAAYEAKRVDAGSRVTWSPELSTLIVGGSALTADGIGYTVVSERPQLAPADLEQATGKVPDEIAATDLALPAVLSPLAVAEADRAVAGAATPYAKALALQAYFRDGFAYDETVDTDNSNDAMTAFLESRRGYCQQFAGTYAAMARHLGIPARVAVGFTTGEQDSADPELFHVRGVHAHAWPEVYLAGKGWVPFEPTPGRGMPGAQSYTGVTEEQATPAGGGATETVPATTAVPVTSAPSGGTAPTTQPREVDTAAGATPREGFLSTWPGRILLAVAGLAGLAGLYVLAVPALHRHRRHRRRTEATAPDEQVEVAWSEGVDDVSLLGLVPARSETPSEFAGRAGAVVDDEGWSRLAGLLVAASYGEAGASEGDGLEALAIADGIHDQVRARVPTRDRLRAELHPRTLRPRPRAGRPRHEPRVEVTDLTR